MKKFTKGMLIAAGIFGAVGIGLTAAGGVMGASMSELTGVKSLKRVLLVADGDYDYDDSDDYDDDDDYEEEVTKKIFSFKDMLNSIAINYGYYLGNVLFNNGPYMLNENSIDNAEEIINEMLKNGMLGYDNYMYYDDDYTNHVYSQKKLEEIELIKSQIRNKQYELAKNILLEKKEIFKILVPKLMTETMLDSGVVEELIYEYFKN